MFDKIWRVIGVACLLSFSLTAATYAASPSDSPANSSTSISVTAVTVPNSSTGTLGTSAAVEGCGTGDLIIENVLTTSFVTDFTFTSSQGNIVSKNIDISILPDHTTSSNPYVFSGVGPIFSATISTDPVWYGLAKNTNYTAYADGTFTTDNGDECTLSGQSAPRKTGSSS